MRRAFIIFGCIGLAAAIWAQQTQMLVLGWNGQRTMWFRLGPTLTVNSAGQVDVAAPASGAKQRQYGRQLQYDTAAAGWIIPAGAQNIALFCNGLRYTMGQDYVISGGVIKAMSDNMQPGWLIVIDYDQ